MKAMPEHPNVTRIRNWYVAFAKSDIAGLDNLFADDLLWHHGGRNQLAGDYHGRSAVYRLFSKLMELTEGTLHYDVHTVLADDEHAVALVVRTASRAGQSIKTHHAHVFHLHDGMIVEFWDACTDQYSADEFIGTYLRIGVIGHRSITGDHPDPSSS